jgi:hypothetical protein
MLVTTEKDKNGDGYKRKDFPGGWTNDSVNGFTGTNLSPAQQDMKDFLKRLMNWRKGKEVIHTGKLKHFIPKDGIYTYFRFNEKECVMVSINNNETEAKTIDRARYSEFLDKYQSGKDIIAGQVITDLSNIVIQPKTAMIIELSR